MSDNRNYAVGVQNQGGAPVYMEDLKLSERSPAPNAASIANLKFLLTTGDDEGFRTAIKSYIDEAIRSALGALVDNLDKGTGVSRILGTDSNHDLGTITLANLSSVLGGVNPTLLTSSDDLNNILDVSKTYITDADVNPANVPNVSNIYNNIIKVFAQGNFVAGGGIYRYVQVLYCLNKEIFYIRVQKGEQWYGWKEFAGTAV